MRCIVILYLNPINSNLYIQFIFILLILLYKYYSKYFKINNKIHISRIL